MNKYLGIQSLLQPFIIFKILQGRNIYKFKVYFGHLGINIHQFNVMSRGHEMAAAANESVRILWMLGGVGRHSGGLDPIGAEFDNCRWVAVAPTLIEWRN
jgi:hypothetical protein